MPLRALPLHCTPACPLFSTPGLQSEAAHLRQVLTEQGGRFEEAFTSLQRVWGELVGMSRARAGATCNLLTFVMEGALLLSEAGLGTWRRETAVPLQAGCS